MELPTRRHTIHNAVNIPLALLWAWFAYVTFERWRGTGSPLGLGLLLVNSTFAWLFLTRRPTKACSTVRADWLVTLLTILLSFTLRPDNVYNGIRETVSVCFQVIGVFTIFLSLLSLGRSFGLVPADRGVKRSGAYAFVRHPLYASELFFYSAFVVGNASLANLVVLLGIFTGLNLRARAEERFLSREPKYSHYLRTVRYRFIPGVL